MPLDAAATEKALAAAGIPAEVTSGPVGALASVASADAVRALEALKAAGADMFVDLFGSDTGEALELTYHLRELETGADAYIRASVAYDAVTASAWQVFPAALYPERELAEMFGVTFEGHPNPKRLLTTDEIGCFPLRKSVPVRSHAEMVRPGILPRGGADA